MWLGTGVMMLDVPLKKHRPLLRYTLLQTTFEMRPKISTYLLGFTLIFGRNFEAV